MAQTPPASPSFGRHKELEIQGALARDNEAVERGRQGWEGLGCSGMTRERPRKNH